MKKIFISLLVGVIIVCSVTGCGHQHTFAEATCTSPKVCTECGETEGVALGHTWIEADCENPKTCSVCNATEGAALGHTWMEANCENPKMCSVCNTTEGDALGHSVDAGVCGKCNKIVNEDLINEVFDYFGKGSDASTAAVNNVNAADVSSLTDTYSKIKKADSDLNTVKQNMQKIYDLCGDYKGLKDIKTAAKAIIDDIPSQIEGSDRDSIVAWLTEFQTYLKTCSSSFSTMAEYASKLSEAN